MASVMSEVCENAQPWKRRESCPGQQGDSNVLLLAFPLQGRGGGDWEQVKPWSPAAATQ